MPGLIDLSGGGVGGGLRLAGLLFLAFLLSLILSRFQVRSARTTRASWYGGAFHGRLAASGRPYNMLAFTAAHRTFPLGSWVRVINLKNRRSVIVRVTDRGPYRMDMGRRDGCPRRTFHSQSPIPLDAVLWPRRVSQNASCAFVKASSLALARLFQHRVFPRKSVQAAHLSN